MRKIYKPTPKSVRKHHRCIACKPNKTGHASKLNDRELANSKRFEEDKLWVM